MADKSDSVDVTHGGANYVGWRGELLAELALARIPELSVHKPKSDTGYDFLVAGPSGVCFFVLVKAFSSQKLRVRDISQAEELRWQIDTESVVQARESHTPVFIFLIDADTEHGRRLRLDTVDVHDDSSETQTLRFLRDDLIDKRGIENLVAGLERQVKVAIKQR